MFLPVLSWLLLSSSLLLQYLPDPPRHLQIANAYVGVVEEGSNRGAIIHRFQNFVGIPQGYPYCAAFVSYVNYYANPDYPRIKSALAQKFITKRSIKAIDVYKGKVKLAPGAYIVVWKHGSTPRGHVGYEIIQLTHDSLIALEANASMGNGKEGIVIKRRWISPYSYFRITHFTPIRYRQGE